MEKQFLQWLRIQEKLDGDPNSTYRLFPRNPVIESQINTCNEIHFTVPDSVQHCNISYPLYTAISFIGVPYQANIQSRMKQSVACRTLTPENHKCKPDLHSSRSSSQETECLNCYLFWWVVFFSCFLIFFLFVLHGRQEIERHKVLHHKPEDQIYKYIYIFVKILHSIFLPL